MTSSLVQATVASECSVLSVQKPVESILNVNEISLSVTDQQLMMIDVMNFSGFLLHDQSYNANPLVK